MNFLLGGNPTLGGSGWFLVCGLFRFGLGILVAAGSLVIRSLGTGSVHDHLAAHERLIVQDLHCAFRFLHVGHVDESVALGLVGVAIVNDLHLADCSYSFEEFFQIILRGVVGEVADIKAGGLHLGWVGCFFALALFLATLAPGVSFLALGDAATSWLAAPFLGRFLGWSSAFRSAPFIVTSSGRGGLLVEADGLQDLLPKGKWLLARTSAARGLELVALLTRASAAAAAVVSGVAIATSPSSASLTAIAVSIAVPVSVAISMAAIPAAAVAVPLILVLFRHCLLSVRELEPGRPPDDKQGKDIASEFPLALDAAGAVEARCFRERVFQEIGGEPGERFLVSSGDRG